MTESGTDPAPARCDVAIVGGGPVGCALACAAGGLSVVVIERRAREAAGAAPFRPIALSYASRLILERLGAWSGLAATPIEFIHVSQAGSFGRTVISAADAGVPALGYVVEYGALAAALSGAAQATRARFVYGARVGAIEVGGDEAAIDLEAAGAPERLAARCIVHAEGASAEARTHDYGYAAVLGRVEVEPGAQATAFERFTAEGPLALLPMTGGYAFVWSLRPERAAELAACEPEVFLSEFARVAGPVPGRPVAVGARAVQPLVLRVRGARAAARQVYVGNAAQTLHPVAGQGLNVGLRDAWDLAAVWRDAEDPGAAHTLREYARARRLDAGAAVRVTDWLARGFTGTAAPLAAARGMALTALDVLPHARRFFARRMIFGASALP